MTSSYEQNIFLNCPFDPPHESFFHAMVFTVTYCGFTPRCAKEIRNSGLIRINKIYDLIKSSKYGIHDISLVSLDADTNLPRFNMPFELGIFLGAQNFGNPKQRNKNCLIFERDQYSYQKYISDIGGQDICHHNGNPQEVIGHIRNWILTFHTSPPVPSIDILIDRYDAFYADLPALCSQARFNINKLEFLDFYNLIVAWMVQIDSIS